MIVPAEPIAVVLYSRGEAIDELMAAAVERLLAEGVRIGGFVQRNFRPAPTALCSFEFEDVLTGARYRVGRGRDPLAPRACALDLAAFTEASIVLRRAVEEEVDLVIVNKFGAQEAAGHGMRPELLTIAASGIPLLTAVSRRYLAPWQAFVGGHAAILSTSLSEVLDWASAICGERRPPVPARCIHLPELS